MDDVVSSIEGRTAAEIAGSVRALLERGALQPGDSLPPVRALAERLGVNRNTAVAAYGLLSRSGLVVAGGRAGTRIAHPEPVAQEGFSHADPDPSRRLRDVGAGNPDPAWIPDPSAYLGALAGRPVLYGEPVIDPDLEADALAWMRADAAPAELRLTLTSGAVDAVERLLAQALTRDDAIALEDPCWLANIHTVRLAGYRAVPVPVDAEGMTVDGLRAALAQGVRAVICTPRAQNPTGHGLSDTRAAQLRAVLADHPYVLVIEDDHFSLLSQQPFRSIVGPDHRRWALVRSVSKFLGPDMCLAVTASDPHTAERLALRLSSGTTWVSHLLQRLAHAILADPNAQDLISRAGAHYAARNAAFAELLSAHDISTRVADGLSVWVPVEAPAPLVAAELRRRGWLVRTGDEFYLDSPAEPHLRLTVHDLTDAESVTLVTDLAASIAAAR
ncbi:aminotransferase class I/II-fold pyridoxal phosphate-dependent enzyme [Microbacterium stercoris]|uniref:Aminotransferase class I/II-fold pyridoxal phosphate-dependent enzyme n=1 Tax=Microbacterium stercoris TaxID=2820289 RepID=A0A939QKG0_9MICO|nr:aminotransferase class I/II-fold pyridoxal phosphate-dependent enzyme [Microbacterium stercoris]MBO3664287.1 aminotransferase class I/II-fold pyridoxal phosphate-dependent enzyme [Microbacterium stercoris]MBO3664534.1 aminotransferase class I/II-fold pyridoxal phosphate-dependent enzyme [Microbacterium stercoris]